MSIGEALADARRRAGLTVSEVSHRTRIRETLIREIEADDYSACGGDFYARGHIRSIAKAVGTDAVPFIEAYDTLRREAAEADADADAAPPVAPLPWERGGGPAWPGGEAQPGRRPADAAGGREPRGPRTGRPGPPPEREETVPGGAQPPGPQPPGPQPPGPQAPVPGPLPPGPQIPVPAPVPPPGPRDGTGTRPRAPRAPTGRRGARPSGTTPDPAWGGKGGVPDAAGGPPAAHRDPGGPAGGRGRAHLNWVMVLVLALTVALGVFGYRLLAGAGQAAPTAGSQPAARGSGGPAPTGGAPPTASPSQASHPHSVVVRLTAVRGCSVEFTTPGGTYLSRSHVPAGTSQSWTFTRPVDMRLCKPGRFTLTVNGVNPVPTGPGGHSVTLRLSPGHPPAVATQPVQATPVLALAPVSVSAFGPGNGGQGDNPQLAPLAIDGHSGTAWHTDWYTSPRFGNLYQGTGLLLDMGRTVTITRAKIKLGAGGGADLELRVGDSPSLTAMPAVAGASGAAGVVRFHLSTPARGRYVLIWFTKLPPDSSGTYEASVYDVSLRGHPG